MPKLNVRQEIEEFVESGALVAGKGVWVFPEEMVARLCDVFELLNTARIEYFATGYTREELKTMHPNIELKPEGLNGRGPTYL